MKKYVYIYIYIIYFIYIYVYKFGAKWSTQDQESSVTIFNRERSFVELMHQKKANAETLYKTWFFP